MKHAIRRCLTLIGAALLLAMPAAAFTPYTPYNYDSYNHSTPSANGYEAAATYTTASMGLTGAAADLHVVDGKVYVLAENGVAVLDEQLRPLKTITTFTYDGEAQTLNQPRGLFVQDEDHILIADTENRRVLECDGSGRITRILEKPSKGVGEENKGYLEKLDFRPVKVLYAGRGDIYVLVENCYLGILRYSADSAFHGFFAANQVEASLSQMIDKLWKKLLTKQQRSYIANYVPVDYSSFDIDAEGFIYTTTSKSNSTLDEIRKLNTVGKNILRTDMQYDTLNRGDYGDRDKLTYRQKYYDSKLIDVAASDTGTFAALDQQRGRVFVYDQDSNLLFAFGGTGEQTGLFRKPAAVDYRGDDILVLDSEKNALTLFTPTLFGGKVLEATAHNAAGRYDLALGPWREVLRYDAGYESAYRGIGKAYVAMDRYEEALPYLQRGGDRENYSKAFKVVRSAFLQQWFYLVIAVLAAAVALLVCRKRLWRAVSRGRPLFAALRAEEHPTYPMRHLITGFDELRRTRSRASLVVACLLVVLWFFATLFMRQYTGFTFNMENPRELNILFIVARTGGIFLLWCLAATGVSAMLDGEGGLRRIATVTAYALTPMVITQFAYVLLSNAAIYDEGALLTALLYIGYLWSAWLLFYGIKEVHQFSVSRTLLAILMTLLGMLFCGLILVLVYGLVQQLITFAMTIFNELILRSV